MMVQPSSTGYIPLGLMGDPVTTTGTHMLYKGGEGKAEPGQPGRKPPGPVRVSQICTVGSCRSPY